MSQAESSTGTATPSTSVAAPTGKPLPLRIRRSIRERYDPDFPELLSQARKLTSLTNLNLVPNFEHNYAALAAFEATLDRNDGDDNGKLSEYWHDQLGQMTLEYFQGFVDTLRSEGFKDDDLQQEAFAEAVSGQVVEVRILEDGSDIKAQACDCVVQDGKLLIRTTVENWGVATSRCCEGLISLL